MKKKICGMLAVFVLCALMAGCTIEVEEQGPGAEESGYHLFYLAASEDGLVKENYAPAEETSEFMLSDLMQRLGKKEDIKGGLSLLSAEVSINSYDRRDDLLIIDFNRAYTNMSSAREILVRAGVAQTFLQIPGIRAVRFTVAGNALLNAKNEKVEDMDRETFLELSGEDPDSYRYGTFTLYFTDRSGEKLVEETRNVYYKSSLSRERVVLEQLAKGPMEKGNYPTIPGNSAVENLIVADRVCYVTMNRSFGDSMDVSPEISLYSVVNSLLAVSDADKVKLSVGNQSGGTLGGSVQLYAFYEKNLDLVAPAQEEGAE